MAAPEVTPRGASGGEAPRGAGGTARGGSQRSGAGRGHERPRRDGTVPCGEAETLSSPQPQAAGGSRGSGAGGGRDRGARPGRRDRVEMASRAAVPRRPPYRIPPPGSAPGVAAAPGPCGRPRRAGAALPRGSRGGAGDGRASLGVGSARCCARGHTELPSCRCLVGRPALCPGAYRPPRPRCSPGSPGGRRRCQPAGGLALAACRRRVRLLSL